MQRVASTGGLPNECEQQLVISQEEHRLTGHKGAILCLAFHNNLLFSSSADLTIKVPLLFSSADLTNTVQLLFFPPQLI
jgi:hypothetical protein